MRYNYFLIKMHSYNIPRWRQIQKENFSNLEKLSHFLELSPAMTAKLCHRKHFPLNLPQRLAKKIQKGTLDDPILRQFVPLQEEEQITDGFSIHPTEDIRFSKTSCLLQKYSRRALLITTSACAMHCRFCFRQNYPYDSSDKSFQKELDLIAQDSSLVEIILSGGDPLSLGDDQLSKLITSLHNISHLKLLRFHTRFPIGIPERITDGFLAILEKTRLQVIFVTHINHPLELDADVKHALKKIQSLGIPLLNHTVLLKGVNDSLQTMIELNLALAQSGIIPYYLNQLDKVQGCSHFEVDQETGLKLCTELRKELPGYAVPRYIQEIPGEKHKTIL